MAWIDGSLGWLGFANEAVAYGPLGATEVEQQGISCRINDGRNRISPPTLGSVAPDVGSLIVYTAPTVQCQLAYSHEYDDVGVLYNTCANGAGAAGSHNFVDTPDATSVSVLAAYRDTAGTAIVEYDVLGCIPRKIQWNLLNNGPSTIDVELPGKSFSAYEGSARTVNLPPDSEIVLPGSLQSTFTMSGPATNTFTSLKSATIVWERPMLTTERIRLGASMIPQPVTTDRIGISGTFVLEFDTATNNDTLDIVTAFLANTSLGTVVVDRFTIGGAVMMGDIPELARGMRDLTVNWKATSLALVTT